MDYPYFAEKIPSNYTLLFFSSFLLKMWLPYVCGLGLVSTRKFSLLALLVALDWQTSVARIQLLPT